MKSLIEINPRKCNGKPVIAGTRIPVTVIIDQLADAGSIKGVVKRYPELSIKQIEAALQYCRSVIEHTEIERASGTA